MSRTHTARLLLASVLPLVLMAAGGRIVAQGTPAELMDSQDPEVRQFVRGEPDGPVKFHYPAPEIADDFGLGLGLGAGGGAR